MPAPQNKPGVQKILGMVNYLAKFIPEMSEMTARLRKPTLALERETSNRIF
jgi:hypothetical protein